MRVRRNKISPHISYIEATKSRTALKKNIDNTPNEEQITAMKLVATKVFEPLRERFGVPLGISSFFRSPALNKAIGGAKNSSHTRGEAIDIDADMFGLVTNRELFDYTRSNLNFDQLIWEFGDNEEPSWIHVSYKASGNRNEVLKAYKIKDWLGINRTKYIIL